MLLDLVLDPLLLGLSVESRPAFLSLLFQLWEFNSLFSTFVSSIVYSVWQSGAILRLVSLLPSSFPSRPFVGTRPEYTRVNILMRWVLFIYSTDMYKLEGNSELYVQYAWETRVEE